MKKYKYSEIFHSFQGEGHHVSKGSIWYRAHFCNLSCDGFGQADPTDPKTYIKPYQTIDLKDITDVEQLPVFDYGCDSSYSWSKRFKHLMKEKTAEEICDELTSVGLRNQWNPEGLFAHPSGQHTHMCFTGGEPMLCQDAIVDIITTFRKRKNMPNFVTVETNGTRKISNELSELLIKHYAPAWMAPSSDGWPEREWFWSVSPKLFSTSGELPKRAIKPEVVADYAKYSNNGQLKYVVNGTLQSWKEVEETTKQFRDLGVNWDVWIMAVGATKQQQETDQIADIAMETIQRGYYFSGRLHCNVFGNKIGK